MADILLDNESAPSTPASGKSVLWLDSTTKKGPIQTDDAGHHYGLLSRNFATAASQAFSSGDTYITNSGLLIPSFGVQAGFRCWWRIPVSKTAAGTAAATIVIRSGTGQSTSDTSVLSLAQTTTTQAAVVGAGILDVWAYLTVVGASAILSGAWAVLGGATAFVNGANAQSGSFNSATVMPAGSFIGLSLNVGASGAWTTTGVLAEMTG